MAEIVANCPRCHAQKITFDITQAHITGVEYGWQQWYEAFCICRHCRRATIFVLSESVDGNYKLVHEKGLLSFAGAVNRYVDIERFISLKDTAATEPPEHLPENVERIFREGATCLAVNCNNAAGTMFRLCIDILSQGECFPKGKRKARTPVSGGIWDCVYHGCLTMASFPKACENYRPVSARMGTTAPMRGHLGERTLKIYLISLSCCLKEFIPNQKG